MEAKYGQALHLASTTELTRGLWLEIRQQGNHMGRVSRSTGLSPYRSHPTSLWHSTSHTDQEHSAKCDCTG